MKFLPEPRDQQQPVVRRGAHHQDEQDSLRLTRQREVPGVGEVVDDETRQRERTDRGQQHQERQRDRPIDQEEDHQHRQDRDDQQDPVNPGEGRDQVGEDPGRAGDVAGAAVGLARRDPRGSPLRPLRAVPLRRSRAW